MGESVYDLLSFQAGLRPSSLAVVADRRAVSYRQLVEDVAGMSSLLLELGLADAPLVAIDLGTSYVHLLVILALDRLNVASVSLSVADRTAAAWLLRQDAVVVSAAERPAGTPLRWITLAEEWKPRTPGPEIASDRAADPLVRLILSSGTTGAPKGIPFLRSVQVARMRSTTQVLGLSPETRLLNITFSTAQGNTPWLATLAVGGLVVLAPPAEAVSAIATFAVTHLLITPYWLELLLRATSGPAPRLPSLRCLDVAGSHLPPDMAAQALALLTPYVFNTYGTTEAGRLAFAHASILARGATAAGYVVPENEVQIVDEADRPLPAGSPGRIRARGPGVITGVYGRTDTGAADGWFYPKDVAVLDGSGLLRIESRTDEVINHGGVKIDPLAIEEVLRAQPSVRDAAVFPVRTPSGITEPWAAVVGDAGPLDLDALRNAVRRRLGIHALVRVVRVPALPRNRNGKVLRGELSAWAARSKERAQA